MLMIRGPESIQASTLVAKSEVFWSCRIAKSVACSRDWLRMSVCVSVCVLQLSAWKVDMHADIPWGASEIGGGGRGWEANANAGAPDS